MQNRMNSRTNRAVGALMGAFIGDALGLGCHWYYDLEELRREFGPWISDYTTPKPGRYHAGMKAGQLSQAGLITKMLLESSVALRHLSPVARGLLSRGQVCQRLRIGSFERHQWRRSKSSSGHSHRRSGRRTGWINGHS
jgi:ADP-ribosylglycohydrolase